MADLHAPIISESDFLLHLKDHVCSQKIVSDVIIRSIDIYLSYRLTNCIGAPAKMCLQLLKKVVRDPKNLTLISSLSVLVKLSLEFPPGIIDYNVFRLVECASVILSSNGGMTNAATGLSASPWSNVTLCNYVTPLDQQAQWSIWPILGGHYIAYILLSR